MIKNRLKELRKILGLSQRAFCEKIGMNQTTYASFETGKRELKDAYVKLICKTYNVREEWIRGEEGEVFEKHNDENTVELLEIYDSLSPKLKEYLLNQIKELVNLQNLEDESN